LLGCFSFKSSTGWKHVFHGKPSKGGNHIISLTNIPQRLHMRCEGLMQQCINSQTIKMAV
jgi:hypothetical protein